MKELKLKDIKWLVKNELAEDVTNKSYEELKEMKKELGLEEITASFGVYGMNGMLLKDKNNKQYAITARNTNLYLF